MRVARMYLVFVFACSAGTAKQESPRSIPADASVDAAPVAPTGAHWEALRDGKRVLDFYDRPGVILDTTAPPPPGPTQPVTHPFLSGVCSGDPLVCVRAGELLRASRDTRSFIEALRKDGFDVRPNSDP